MAATTAANQLKLEEMGSAGSMLLFVKGFAIAVLARTMRRQSNGKRVAWCVHLQLPPAWLGCCGIRSLLSKALAQCVWLLIIASPSSLALTSVQYHLPSATNTHVKLTYTFLFSSHPILGGPLHQARTDQTVVETSLKLYSYLITEGSEMFIVLCASILLVISILPSVHLQLSQ